MTIVVLGAKGGAPIRKRTGSGRVDVHAAGGVVWRRRRSELFENHSSVEPVETPVDTNDDLLPGIASLMNGALFSSTTLEAIAASIRASAPATVASSALTSTTASSRDDA